MTFPLIRSLRVVGVVVCLGAVVVGWGGQALSADDKEVAGANDKKEAAAAAPGKQDEDRTEPAGREILAAVVEQLIAEAKELDKWKEAVKVSPHLGRPHPALAGLGADDVDRVLARMTGTFTGNIYRDTYIRWHLLHVVYHAPYEKLRGRTRKFVDLLDKVPPSVRASERSQWEPHDVWQRWHGLYHSVNATTGYPPYQQTIYGPAALPLLPEAQREAAKQRLAAAEKLRGKWRVNPHVERYNQRVRWFNHTVREYRGELIQCMVRTGDAKALEMIINSVDKNIRGQSMIGFDLISYVYQAAFEGSLSQYDQEVLEKFRKALESVARREERYEAYGGLKRNFADFAFHLVYMLGHRELLEPPQKPPSKADEAAKQPKAKKR